MRSAIRLLILMACPVLFWAAWHVMPELFQGSRLAVLTTFVGALWMLEFALLRRMSSLASINGISSREREKLLLRLASYRERVWYVVGIALTAGFLIWLVTSIQSSVTELGAVLLGALFGIVLSYLVLAPFWFQDVQNFIDEVGARDAEKRKLDEFRKELAAEKREVEAGKKAA